MTQVHFTILLLLLFLLSISFLGHEALAGRRYLEAAETQKKPQIWNKTSSKNNSQDDNDEGFVAAINREVPSSPDPLHNR